MNLLPDHFLGYRRCDGSVGVRNHLAVVSTVALTNRWAELVAGSTALLVSGEFIRGLRAADAVRQDQVILALATHPNVGACLVLCHDASSARLWRERLATSGRPHEVLALMEQQGMRAALAAGRTALASLEKEREQAQRVPCPVSALTVALECGGSDPTSALVANPAIGRVVDALIGAGGKALLHRLPGHVGRGLRCGRGGRCRGHGGHENEGG